MRYFSNEGRMRRIGKKNEAKLGGNKGREGGREGRKQGRAVK